MEIDGRTCVYVHIYILWRGRHRLTNDKRIYIYIVKTTTTTSPRGWLYIYASSAHEPVVAVLAFPNWSAFNFSYIFYGAKNAVYCYYYIHIYASTEKSAVEEGMKTRERPIYYNMYLSHVYHTVAYIWREHMRGLWKPGKLGESLLGSYRTNMS